MSAVEIEQAISGLALHPFDAAEFPFTLLVDSEKITTPACLMRTCAENLLPRFGVDAVGCDLRGDLIDFCGVTAPVSCTENLHQRSLDRWETSQMHLQLGARNA
jgi:hypothetical protein